MDCSLSLQFSAVHQDSQLNLMPIHANKELNKAIKINREKSKFSHNSLLIPPLFVTASVAVSGIG